MRILSCKKKKTGALFIPPIYNQKLLRASYKLTRSIFHELNSRNESRQQFKAEDKSFLFYVKKRRLLAGARRSASLHTDSHYIPSKREFHSFPTATAEQRSFKDTSNKFILQKKVKNNDNAGFLFLSLRSSVVSSEKIKLVHSRVFRLQPWHQCRNLDPAGPPRPGTLSLLEPRGQSVLP